MTRFFSSLPLDGQAAEADGFQPRVLDPRAGDRRVLEADAPEDAPGDLRVHQARGAQRAAVNAGIRDASPPRGRAGSATSR